MSNNYKGYSLFNDVSNVKLRTWNRCAALFNLNTDIGDATGYASQLTQSERAQCMAMLAYIDVKGYEDVKREVMREQ